MRDKGMLKTYISSMSELSNDIGDRGSAGSHKKIVAGLNVEGSGTN